MNFFEYVSYIYLHLSNIPPNGVSLKEIENTMKSKLFFFNCTTCGKCCKGKGNVYFSQEDISNLKKYLKLQPQEWKDLVNKVFSYKKNGYYVHKTYFKCFFLDNQNKCSIYPIRPLQCRTFPFWPSHFKKKENLDSLIHNCPGSKVLERSYKKFDYRIYSKEKIFLLCNKNIKNFNQNQREISDKKDYIIL